MRNVTFAAVAALLAASALWLPLTAQGNGNGPAARIHADIQRAIRNGNPTEAELATLQKALATLKARPARLKGQTVDRQRVRDALTDTEKVFRSNSFRPADRQAVQRDIKDIRGRYEKK